MGDYEVDGDMRTFLSLIPAIAFVCLCCGAVMVKADYEGRVIFGGIVAYSIFAALILLGLGIEKRWYSKGSTGQSQW